MNQVSIHGAVRLKIGKTQNAEGHSWTVLDIEHSVHGTNAGGKYTETTVVTQIAIHHRLNQVLLIDQEGS
jgi:hypothetical protein